MSRVAESYEAIRVQLQDAEESRVAVDACVSVSKGHSAFCFAVEQRRKTGVKRSKDMKVRARYISGITAASLAVLIKSAEDRRRSNGNDDETIGSSKPTTKERCHETLQFRS